MTTTAKTKPTHVEVEIPAAMDATSTYVTLSEDALEVLRRDEIAELSATFERLKDEYDELPAFTTKDARPALEVFAKTIDTLRAGVTALHTMAPPTDDETADVAD